MKLLTKSKDRLPYPGHLLDPLDRLDLLLLLHPPDLPDLPDLACLACLACPGYLLDLPDPALLLDP